MPRFVTILAGAAVPLLLTGQGAYASPTPVPATATPSAAASGSPSPGTGSPSPRPTATPSAQEATSAPSLSCQPLTGSHHAQVLVTCRVAGGTAGVAYSITISDDAGEEVAAGRTDESGTLRVDAELPAYPTRWRAALNGSTATADFAVTPTATEQRRLRLGCRAPLRSGAPVVAECGVTDLYGNPIQGATVVGVQAVPADAQARFTSALTNGDGAAAAGTITPRAVTAQGTGRPMVLVYRASAPGATDAYEVVAGTADPVVSAVTRAWQARPELGWPIGNETCGLSTGGCFQVFQHGTVYQGPAGTALVRGRILEAWNARGGESGFLGGAIGEEECGLAGGGCRQAFRNGMIYAGPRGAYAVRGDIATAYDRNGTVTGIGYPLMDQSCGLIRGGCYQRFDGGIAYDLPGTPAYVVRGRILDYYAGTTWERGWLGYPVSDEVCTPDQQCVSDFENGRIAWSIAGGAQPLRGRIGDWWRQNGEFAGYGGAPLSGEFCGLRDGGCFQRFQGGSVYWSPASGAHQVRGLIAEHWGRTGWERGRFGYPVTEELCSISSTGARVCRQDYQRGRIEWSSTGGIREF